jgi:ATP-binding cassette subfamily B multidrug efflux pump
MRQQWIWRIHLLLIVLDRGRIAENGSHDELLSLGGIYASLWTHQSGFLPTLTRKHVG